MTNKEKYKQAFGTLHASGEIRLEASDMKREKWHARRYIPKSVVAACTAITVIAGSFGVAYAANVGGIQRTIQVWMHGEQTTAELSISEGGNYTMTYEDEGGALVERGGGGVAIDENGKERALTEEEIMEHLNAPDVYFEDDGTVWVYYMNQKLEITDKFDKDGFSYVKLDNQGEITYLTVNQADGGYAWSNKAYIQPNELN